MSKSQKTERLYIRLTPEEKKKIVFNSQLMGISITEYISLCVRRRRIVICEDFPKFIYHLSKIGNNINQISAVANTNKYISQDSIDEIKKLMTSCYGKLTDFIDFITEPERGLETATDRMPEMMSAICEMMKSLEEKIENQNKV